MFQHHFNLVINKGAILLKYPSRPSHLPLQIWPNKNNNLHVIDQRNSQRSPLTREKRPSRRSRSRRRSTHRRRDPSPKPHRQEIERRTTMTRSTFDRHPSRTERPSTTSRTPRTEPIDGRRRDHPIYRRENTFRQVHQDANSTVYTKDTKDKAKSTYGSNFQRSRKDSTITLRSRSKSRKSKRSTTSLAIFERPPGVLLVAKARPDRPKGPEDTTIRETSVSEATESETFPWKHNASVENPSQVFHAMHPFMHNISQLQPSGLN